MSSPHCQPENAAPAVPLSPPSADSGSGPGAGPAGAGSGPGSALGPSLSPGLGLASASESDPAGLPSPAPAGQPTAAEAVLLSRPRPPPASSGEATLSHSHIDVDPSLHHAAPATPSGPPGTTAGASQEDGQQHKKSRPSAHHQNVSQQGPSLLTRALASARGIATHASAQPLPASHQDKRGNQSTASPTDTAAHPPTSARINANAQYPSTTADKQHDAHSQHGDNASITEPRSTPSPAMATPATIPVTPVPVSRRDAASVPSSFTRSTLTEVRDMFYENRRPTDPTLRRSSTSLDIDRRALAADSTRALLYSGATDDNSSTPTKASYLMGNALSRTAADAAAAAKDLPHRHRPPPPEHRFTLGPEKTEKIWSIGSGDGFEEDGLVEKSVTEAMTGVEHNGRSRKSSYSLRFFKEGLPPEDKARRKDRDTKASQRERLPATAEEDSEERWRRNQLLREIRQRRQSYVSEAPSRTGNQSPSLMSQASTSLATEADTDYFSLDKASVTHQTTPTSSGTPPPVQPGPDVVLEPETIVPEQHAETTLSGEDEEGSVAELRRHSGDSTEVGESHDDRDADESGEEKISSAVFVPHQEASDVRSRDAIGTSSGANARPRSMIQDESHNWLVKADEPEPQSDDNAELPGRLSRLRSVESLVSTRGDLVSEAPSDEFGIEGEEELASQSAQGVSRVGNHYDDRDHEPHISKPLEAIELIPYKHQVGGHTTIWRFSRRAVCKQLNNRENEFYETIERFHRDLLPFLPRYVDYVCLCCATSVPFDSIAYREFALLLDFISFMHLPVLTRSAGTLES